MKELGKPEHSQFASYMTEVAGEASPKAIEDFRAMSIDEIVAFLREWTPSGGFMEPTICLSGCFSTPPYVQG